MKFSGIQKTSLIDYTDHISTILFTAGCNLRCPYCHNWRIVLDYKGPFLSEDQAINILEERRKFIDHIVITGGEPTIHKDLTFFLRRLKKLGYKIKLDSNGMLPRVINKALPYIDYIAVDVKTSLDLYPLLKARNPKSILQTINLLKRSKIDYEFRCTVAPGFVDEEILPRMGEMVKGAKRFAFQQFVPEDTLDPDYKSKEPFSNEKIALFRDIMSDYVEEVILRI